MVLVIEEGLPNGMDLVVGEHRLRQKPPQAVMELGNGLALSVPIQIVPQFDETKENVGFFLTCLAGPISDIAGFRPRPLLLAQIGSMPLADLVSLIEGPKAPEETA